jgi:2-hydroxy-3-oxopropionate reductase
MTRIAFIGLGIMGAPMAANLVRAGHDVIVYNRTAAKATRLAEIGATVAGSVAEAVRDAEVVATMLPDSPDVTDVLQGSGAALANARPGAIFIDFSTIKPETAVALHADATAKGYRMVDAPVSGGEQGAIDGTLSIMVGGAADDFAVARDVCAPVGKTIVHVGPIGSGQTVKAANQLIVAGNLALVAEAITLLEAHGVAAGPALDVLAGGLAGSTVLARKGAAMLNWEFKPGFRLSLHNKDMGIVLNAARQAGVAIPMGSLAAQLIGALVAQGYGEEDHSALVRVIASLSGRADPTAV